MTNGGGNNFLAVIFMIVFEIIAATAIFFILIAIALLFDFGIIKLTEFLDVTESKVLFYVRQGGKIFILAMDCVIVGSYILKSSIKIIKEIWRRI